MSTTASATVSRVIRFIVAMLPGVLLALHANAILRLHGHAVPDITLTPTVVGVLYLFVVTPFLILAGGIWVMIAFHRRKAWEPGMGLLVGGLALLAVMVDLVAGFGWRS